MRYKYSFIIILTILFYSGCTFKPQKKCNYEEYPCAYDKQKVIYKVMKFYKELDSKNYHDSIGSIMTAHSKELEKKLGKAQIVSCYDCLLHMDQKLITEYFTPELQELLTKYQNYNKLSNEKKHIDFLCRDYNFIVDAQDEWIRDFHIKVNRVSDDYIIAKVQFNNFNQNTIVYFDFIKIRETWLIQDIHNSLDSFQNHFQVCLKDYEQLK